MSDTMRGLLIAALISIVIVGSIALALATGPGH